MNRRKTVVSEPVLPGSTVGLTALMRRPRGKLDGRGRHEVLQGAVGKRCGSASSNRLPPDHASGESERSTLGDVWNALSHNLYLTESLIAQTGEKVGALQLLERFERNRSNGRYDGIDLADLLEQGTDRIRIQNVHR